MIRPQLKDMHMSGFDAHQVGMNGKKKTAAQPPMNASPGELRLWRKLNGMLSSDEQKVESLEHGKSKSRANLAGRPRRASSPLRPSESELLYKEPEEARQQQFSKRSASPAASPRLGAAPRAKATPPRTRSPIAKKPQKAASPRPSPGMAPPPPRGECSSA